MSECVRGVPTGRPCRRPPVTAVQVTYTSDYFDRLYELARELIRRGHAYVCHQSAQEMRENIPSKWRDRPIEESLQLFGDMHDGMLDEGEATLRMKHVMEDGKLDPVAYRIKFVPHFRTGDRWCIYPTYDYSHPLVDSMENITHSMCTKEFQNHRPTYYWLCNALDLYCPVQWEYGRLGMSHTILSKRKIQQLIDAGLVRDWDDARLHTLMGLRRRGFPPAAINAFCRDAGVTMSLTILDPPMLEHHVRDELNRTAPRAMVVLDPLPVTIVNYPEKEQQVLTVPNFPADADTARGTHTVTFSRRLFIERADFAMEPERDYRRLTPAQSVGLKYIGIVLSLQEVVRSADGAVAELRVTYAPATEANKPKAFIHWVACDAGGARPLGVEVRLIDVLFHHRNPEDKEAVPGGWLSDFNQHSLVVKHAALADDSLRGVGVGRWFQFERHGFFYTDPDTTIDRPVLNLTVKLREAH